MTTTDETIEQIRERAALYALGLLAPDEARAVEACLVAGDTRYVAEVAAFRSVADAMAYAAEPRPPRPVARDRVLERIAAQPVPVVEVQGVRFVRGGALGWEATLVPGLEIKTLLVDAARGRATVLARMVAGSVYPNHRHRDLEEIYVLEGDLVANGVTMHAGDYCNAGVESVHGGIRTDGGCVFLVTAGTDDELFV